MCGIAGYWNVEGGASLLEQMNQAQAHRGPDGEGIFMHGKAGLAHRRLAIIDKEGGHQPLFSPDGKLAVVYNGEIYNFQELRKELEDSGFSFKTHSDTEVIVQAYSAWGEAAFDRFNGMFAFALYDQRVERLFLVRDHFGIKPLYFAAVEQGVLFASEIKALLASGKIQKKPNDRTIYRYLSFRVQDEGRETFFAGIERLLPGEMMVLDAEGIQIRPYTKLEDELEKLAKENRPYGPDRAKEYEERLIEAVRMRLVSEVPVGTCLSGGLDSSTLVAIVNRLLQEKNSSAQSVGAKQNTFSAVFPNSANDEERYVDAILGSCEGHVNAHKIYPNADDFAKNLQDFIRTQEEPTVSTGPYAQYKVMEEAKNHVTVLLDGQGADETMAGYVPYSFVYLRQLKKEGKWLKFLGETFRMKDIFYRFARIYLLGRLLRKKPVPIRSLLHEEFAKSYSEEKLSIIQDNLKLRLLQDTFKNSLPSLLRYEDKNAMRFSLEGRVPFLDKEVLKYLFSLSDEAILNKGWNKRILRDATTQLLPPLINRRRNKIGFTTPEEEWFMRLKNRFYHIFLSESFSLRPYFNQKAVLEAFEGFIQNKNDSNSMLFWRLLNVELWLREFFDEKVEEVPYVKTDFEANPGKSLDIQAEGKSFRRFTLRTERISAKDDLKHLLGSRVKDFFHQASENPAVPPLLKAPWTLFVSEKIVAITQGRSYFVWDIKPGFWARFLSRRVTKTPYGIGLGSPWTMQLAIQEVGLARILYASFVGGIAKLFGKKGVFYKLAGSDVRAIDGPTEYSVYPSNVSAKLPPKDPDKVAVELSEVLRQTLPAEVLTQFQGCVIIDSNDLGRNVLGQNTQASETLLEAIFVDNPFGQGDEQTPLAVVFEIPSEKT